MAMGIQIERTHQGRRSIKVMRVNGPAGRSLHLVPKTAEEPPPNAHRLNVALAEPLAPIPPADNDSPAARARRATRRLKRLFENARRAAKGRARLRRADQHEILRSAYAAVHAWREDGIVDEVER